MVRDEGGGFERAGRLLRLGDGMKGVADRLLALLRVELRAFETSVKDTGPNNDASAMSGRVRFETIAQMTKTLEKLLDLKRLERLADVPEAADEGEARRLRSEMMRRLRALDARRVLGSGMPFGAEPVAE